MQQAALFAGRQHGDGVGRAGGAQVGALERVHGDVHGGEVVVRTLGAGADLFADEQHRRLVAFAFADDDGAVHGHLVHHLAHGLDGHVVGPVTIALSHGAGAGDGRLLDHAQQLQAQLDFHRRSCDLGWAAGPHRRTKKSQS